MAEYESATIELEKLHKRYFGIETLKKAKEKAASHALPIPFFKPGNQYTSYVCRAEDLANFIDMQAEEAAKIKAEMDAA